MTDETLEQMRQSADRCTTHHICDCRAYALKLAQSRSGTYEHRTRGAEGRASSLESENAALRARAQELEAMRTEEVAQAAMWAHGEATVKLVQQRDEWKARALSAEKVCEVADMINSDEYRPDLFYPMLEEALSAWRSTQRDGSGM